MQKSVKTHRTTSQEYYHSFHLFGFTYRLKEKYAGIAIVNIFWKNLDEEMYGQKNPYENKDQGDSRSGCQLTKILK